MSTEIEAALNGQPWAVSGAIFGVDRILDDEGRPVSERRAPSAVKQGVPIDLRACPYRDHRRGLPMNVSALAQITRHLNTVIDDIELFHSLGAIPDDWRGMLAAVIDQLAAPAVTLLSRGSLATPVPAASAVGHKLAAGYFGVLRSLLAEEAAGEHYSFTIRSFLGFVKERRALVGASEACAGPPHLIERVSHVLIGGIDPDRSPRARHVAAENPLGDSRVAFADTLATQVCLGIGWELFDLAAERELLDEATNALAPRNDFMRKALEQRREELNVESSIPQGTRTPRLPSVPPLTDQLDETLRRGRPSHPGGIETVLSLLACHDGAVHLAEARDSREFANRIAHYLEVYREFVVAQWELETQLRDLLHWPAATLMKQNAAILPAPKALRWFEAVLGHRMRLGDPPGFSIVLGNHRRSAPLLPVPARPRERS